VSPVPAVSIVLPTCDRLHYLRPAIASVLGQTCADWELLIADDGSGEETIRYLRTIEDPRVGLIRLEHTGNPAAVRNAALARARGRYIAFLDSDDAWVPCKLQAQLAAMRSGGERRWSYTAITRIGADGAVMAADATRRWTAHEGAIFGRLLTLEAAVATPAVIAERALVELAGGFDEAQRHFEEYDLWLRMSLLSEVRAIREPLALVRSHHEHYTQDRVGVYESRLRLLEKHAASASALGLTAELRAERAKACVALAGAYARRGCRGPAIEALWHGRRSVARVPSLWGRALRAALRAVEPRLLQRMHDARAGRPSGALAAGRG
jgi:GT2 family glycosyltransferase